MGLGCGIGVRTHGAHRPRGLGARARAGGKLAPVARRRAGRGRPHRAPRRRPRPGPQVCRRDPERLHTASDGQFAARRASLNARPLVQVLRQGPGRQRLHRHRRAPAAVALAGDERRRARGRLRGGRPDAQATWCAPTSTRPTATATPRRSSPSPTCSASRMRPGSRTWATRPSTGSDRATATATARAAATTGRVGPPRPTSPCARTWSSPAGTTCCASSPPSSSRRATASDIFRRLNSYGPSSTSSTAPSKRSGRSPRRCSWLAPHRRARPAAGDRAAAQPRRAGPPLHPRRRHRPPREFEQTDKHDQEVAESCNRLIKNAIVCWSSLCLEHRLRALGDPVEKQDLIDTVGHHAMISRRHVNRLGEHDVSDERLGDSFGLRPPQAAT